MTNIKIFIARYFRGLGIQKDSDKENKKITKSIKKFESHYKQYKERSKHYSYYFNKDNKKM